MQRRKFVAGSTAALAATACSTAVFSAASNQRKLRMAIIGTGSRGSFTWGREVAAGYSDVVKSSVSATTTENELKSRRRSSGPPRPPSQTSIG